MLAIRLQRTGRSGHAMFRMIVQDSRRTPTSGKYVAQIGNYDPRTKAFVVDKTKASFYLEHGAHPSSRVIGLLKNEGVKLPEWVIVHPTKKRVVRNPEKLRKNRPVETTQPETPPDSEPVVTAESTENKATKTEDAAQTEITNNETPTESDTKAAEDLNPK